MDNLSILFDIGVLLIVVICVALGTKRGFIQAVFRLLSTVISLFLARALFPYTKYFLETICVKDVIKTLVSTNLNLTSGTTEITEYSVNSLDLPDFIKTAFLNSDYLKQMQNDATATLKQTISEFVAEYAVTMLSYVITFILAALVLYFLLVILNIFSKLPIFGFFNAGLGGAIGLVSACIIIWVIFAGLNIFLATPDLSHIFDSLDSTIIARMFYKFNPIITLITNANGGF